MDGQAFVQHISTDHQPRAIGQALVSARLRGNQSVLADLRQSGSAKILFPRLPTSDLHAVLLNTAGGITGGDRFEYSASTEANAVLTITTQACERGYRAQPGSVGTLHSKLTLAPGSTLHWLPQETILFDGAALDRQLSVDMAADATLLAVEPIIFGRSAMGETLHDLRLIDQWRVRRDGVLVYADALRIKGDHDAIARRPGTLNGAGAMASLLLIAPDAGNRLEPLRAKLPREAGASLIRPGVLSARILASDGMALRSTLVPILEYLRGAPLPQVWKM